MSDEAPSCGANCVGCRVVNHQESTMRVVLVGHRDGQLSTQTLLVTPGQSASVDCPVGYVVIAVFDPENDALVMLRTAHVTGPFTLIT